MNKFTKKATAIISVLSLLVTALPLSTYANGSVVDEFNSVSNEVEVVSGSAIVTEPEEDEKETIINDSLENVSMNGTEYQIIESVDNIINYEQLSGDLKLTVDCDDTLRDVIIDYESLDACYYSAVDNVIEIDDEYLNSVSAGLHRINIEYENGSVIAELNIIEHIAEDDLEEEEKIKINVDEEIEMLVWYAGSDEDLTFTSDGDVSKIISIAVNDSDLTADEFDIVQKFDDVIEYKINKEYLGNLEEGYHDISITYDNYTVGVKLAVVLNIEEVNKLSENDTTWQEDWDYELQTGSSQFGGKDVIILKDYAGVNTDIVIQPNAVIGGITYDTVYSGINSTNIAMNITSIELKDDVILFSDGNGNNSGLFYFFVNCNDFKIGSVNCNYIDTLRGMFKSCFKLSSIPNLSNIDFKNIKSVSRMFEGCIGLETADFSSYKFNGVEDFSGMLSGCTSLKHVDVRNMITASATNISSIFNRCSELEFIDVSTWNTSNVVDMSGLFYECDNIKQLDLTMLDVSNVENVNSMFKMCSKLTSIKFDNWDTKNIVDAGEFLISCRNLVDIDVSNWNVQSLENAREMFRGCSVLPVIDVSRWNTSSVTTMLGMFAECKELTSIDVSKWDMRNVETINYMFAWSDKLTNIPVGDWSLSNCEDIGSVFNGCIGMTNFDVSEWDVSSVKIMEFVFAGCTGVSSIDISGWNTSNVTTMDNMFARASNLSEIIISSEFKFNSCVNMRGMFENCGINCTDVNIIGLTASSTSNVAEASNMFKNTPYIKYMVNVLSNTSSIKSVTQIIADNDISIVDLSKFNLASVENDFWDNNEYSMFNISSDSPHKLLTPVNLSSTNLIPYNMYEYDNISKKFTTKHDVIPNVSSTTVLYAPSEYHSMERTVIKPATLLSVGIAEDACTECDLVLAVELPKLEVPAGSYLVEFESNADISVEAQVVISGNKVTEPTGLTKVGKVLDGWYTDSACTNQWNFNSPVTSDMKLYAKWADKYTVSFNNDGVVTTADVIQGHKVNEPPKPVKVGHTFKGWFKENTFNTQWNFNDAVESDMTLYAKFDKNSYKVSFDTGESQDVLYQEKIVKPTDPTKKGYTFVGWFVDTDLTNEWDFDKDVVSKEITLYSKFTINSYDVTFNTGLGSAVSKQTIQYGNKVTKPATPTNEGFVLKGWFKDSACTQEWKFNTDIVEDNTILYAKWVAGYNITLIDSIDDSVIDVIGVEDGDIVDEPEVPEHDGYTFKGWYMTKDGNDEYDWSQAVTYHTSVYSQWYKNPVITLLDFSDDSVVDTINVKYNNIPIAPEVDPIKVGKEFLGYFTDKSSVSGSNIFSFNRLLTDDINVYCLFAEEVTYTACGIDEDGNEENRIIAEDSLYKSFINGNDRYLVHEMSAKGYELLDGSNETIEVFNSGVDNDRMWSINGWLQDVSGTPAQYKVVSGSAIDVVFISDEHFPSDNSVYASLKYQYKVKYNVNGNVTDNWILSGSLLDMPNVELGDSYSIVGWYTDQEFNNLWDFESNIVMQPMTLYAKVIDDRGEAIEPDVPVTPTNPVNPPTTTDPTKPTTPPTGSGSGSGSGGSYYPPTNPTNPPLQQMIKIKAVVDGEYYDIDVSVVDGKTVIVTPLKDEYSFDGWYSNEDLTVTVDVSSLNPYEDVTIYGRFVENKLPVELVKVTFVDDSGNEVFVLTLESGDNIDRYVKNILVIDGLNLTVNEYLLQMYGNNNAELKVWMNDSVEWDLTEPVIGNIILKPMFELPSSITSNIKINNLIHLKALNTGKNKTCLKWNCVNGAKYYVVYGAKCGTDFKIIGLVNTSNSNSKDIISYNLYKLNKATWYKFRVVAYKKYPLKSGSKKFTLKKNVKCISKSLAVHTVTTGGKYTNTKAVIIKPEQKNLTLKKGKSIVISATTTLNKKNKITKYHCARIRLKSSNNVVSIKNKTTIVAKRKGTCKIYVYAQNGKKKTIKVTVK